jgi:hypothetical protein
MINCRGSSNCRCYHADQLGYQFRKHNEKFSQRQIRMPNSPLLIDESEFDRHSQQIKPSDRLSKRGKRKWKSFPSIRCATKQQANKAEDDHVMLRVSDEVAKGHDNSDCMKAHNVTFGQQQLKRSDWHVNCDLYQEPEWSDPPSEQSSPGTLSLDECSNKQKDTPPRAETDESKIMLQFPNEDRNSRNAAQGIIPGTAESLAIALKSTLQYTFHLLNEFAPELVRRHAHQNVAAVRNGDVFNVFLPNLREVLVRLRQLLD